MTGVTVTRAALAAVLLPAFILLPSQARAQEGRVRLAVAPAAAALGGDAVFALGGSAGFRFADGFWFEGEFTWIDAAAGGLRNRRFDLDVPSLRSTGLGELVRRRGGMFGGGAFAAGLFNRSSLATLPGSMTRLRAETEGRTLVGTLGIRYEPPVQTERFRPYVAGGLGIAGTEQGIIVVDPLATRPALDETATDTGYAFSAGAGASVRLFKSVWADADAKYFRLSRERNMMRLGGGLSVRF